MVCKEFNFSQNCRKLSLIRDKVTQIIIPGGWLKNNYFQVETLLFKTNINCECCYKAVIPYMEDIKGIRCWEVMIDDPDKILQVEGDQSEQEVINAIMKAGYKIERIS